MKKYIYTSIKVDLIDHKHTKSKVSCVHAEIVSVGVHSKKTLMNPKVTS